MCLQCILSWSALVWKEFRYHMQTMTAIISSSLSSQAKSPPNFPSQRKEAHIQHDNGSSLQVQACEMLIQLVIIMYNGSSSSSGLDAYRIACSWLKLCRRSGRRGEVGGMRLNISGHRQGRCRSRDRTTTTLLSHFTSLQFTLPFSKTLSSFFSFI